MKAVLEELQSAETGRKRLVGRLIFGALVLLAAAIGVVGGLLLVYSTDLPQVEALEHYRPVSSSELYDINGNTMTFGKFTDGGVVTNSGTGTPTLTIGDGSTGAGSFTGSMNVIWNQSASSVPVSSKMMNEYSAISPSRKLQWSGNTFRSSTRVPRAPWNLSSSQRPVPSSAR